MIDMERLLDAVRHVESRGNRFAVSPKGAKGAYQFMPGTAKDLGLVGNDVFDEQKSRNAARKYLGGLISKYGLQGGIGAYNMGAGNLEKNNGNWAAFDETAKYVPAVLAAYDGGTTFKGYSSRPQPAQQRFPIQLIPGAEPQAPVVEHNPNMTDENMAVKEQPKSGHLVDFRKAQKDINQRKLTAETLAKSVNWGDPYAQISGRAIAMNPLSVLANALTQGIANRDSLDAQAAQDDLDIQKAQALQGMMQGGNTNLNDLAASGFLAPEDLAKALTHRQQQAEFNAVYGDNGEIMSFNKLTGEVTPTGKKSALYAPDSVYNRSLANTAGKDAKMTDDMGREYHMPMGMTNPAFGAYGQQQPAQRFDYPTSMMNVPDSAPLPAPQQSVVKGASPIDLKRQEAEAMLAPKIQEAQAVGAIKNAQEAQLAQEKANIDVGKIQAEDVAKAQIDLPRQQANAESAKSLIDRMLTHPGLESTIGVPGITKWMPGTDSQDFQALQDQLQGENFLQAFNSLKGGGQITEIEGKKATDAIAALRNSQSEQSYKENLNILKSVIDKGYERAQVKAGMPGQAPAPTQNKPSVSNW